MNKKAFAVIAFSMFVSMLGFGIVVPLLPIYADKLGATGLEIGIMYAAFGITHAIFLPFMHAIFLPFIGKLSDRMGRKIFLCLGLLSLTFVSIGFIWVQNAFHLIVIRTMQGIATTMHLPIAQAYVGDNGWVTSTLFFLAVWGLAPYLAVC
ncbi:MAG: MFS transporter [Deltaproteobacteria bacterium]|nr:MFS transporter [Deltaproteobacteria bacterium]